MKILKEIIGYFRVFRKYLGRRLYLVFFLTALAVATEAFGIALLLPLLEMIESAPEAADPSRISLILGGILEFLGIRDSMVGILIFIAVVFVIKGAIRFGEGSYMAVLSANLLREIKGSLFDYYSGMDYSYYTGHNTGHFVNIISVQVNRLLHAFEAYKKFLSELIITALYLVFAFLISWKFALMAAVAGFVLLFLFRHLNHYVKTLSRKTSSEYSSLHGLLVQTLQSFPYISATAQFGRLGQKVVDSIYRLTGYYRNQRIAQSFTQAVREPVSVLLILVIVIIQLAVFEARIAPILVALLLIYRSMGHFIAIQSAWQQTMNMAGGLEMVEEEWDRVRRHQESIGSHKPGPLSDRIRFEEVSCAYPGRPEPAVSDLSLQIKARSTVALFGPSGSGKTTITHLLTLLLNPDRGRLLIDEVPHDRIDRTSWRRQIGLVPQDTVIFDDTIANNISLWAGEIGSGGSNKKNGSSGDDESSDGGGNRGDDRSSRDGGSSGDDGISRDSGSSSVGRVNISAAGLRERINEAAERAGAMEFIRELPDGLDTLVGDRGVRLSGGQRQRLAIARELFKQPSLLILDEATSALDVTSENSIRESIRRLHGELTVVIITHRISSIRDADRIFVIEQGKLNASGTFDELSRHHPLFQNPA